MNITSFDQDFATPGEWAHLYRQYGLNVIPAIISEDGKKKHPLGGWKEFQEGPIPQSVFDRWYGEGGEALRNPRMGFLTGRASLGKGRALLVVDLDAKNGAPGIATWHTWLDTHNNGLEIETWTAETGSGGRHLYFRYPASLAIGNSQGVFPGLDTRAQGGFIVAPPSPHYVSGRSYRWLDGFAPWETEIADAPDWLLDLAGSASDISTATYAPQRTETPEHQKDAFGNIIDGRDKLMADMAYARMVDERRECPIPPTEMEIGRICDELYARYRLKVQTRLDRSTGSLDDLLEREGRGRSALLAKLMRHRRNWDGSIAEAAKQPKPARAETPAQDRTEASEAGNETPSATQPQRPRIELLSIDDIFSLPDPTWLVNRYVPEDGLGFVYGEPGTYKSFLTLDLGLHLAYGLEDWHGDAIGKRDSWVLYLAREGVTGFKTRIAAWMKHHGIVEKSGRFRLVKATLNFMDAKDIEELLDAVAREGVTPWRVIVVDTVSRVLPGADENLQKEMTLFVNACDRLRSVTGATIIGVHHAGKNGDMRGSTVLKGAGDFVFRTKKDEDNGRLANVQAEKVKDDEDGWSDDYELKKLDVTLGSVASYASLVPMRLSKEARQANEVATSMKLKWPSTAMCQSILKEIGRHWDAGKPLSNQPQTRRSGRYAPAVLSEDFDLSAELVEHMMQVWIDKRVLSYEEFSAKTGQNGLKVIGTISGPA